ncbi:hypothetical protein GCM10010123_25790 [Pilimelia anulata]|uniref:Uncharacterized protein n=1 Tax=Pilimelia anulata TaxID=53371 RepID=A0A8J3F8W9_9ACTN|nr:hypothetical protein [Pilimelia anulata]GGJ94801.1 hypothetical protein GCM10010123_25790 [Pilimelia anulata]
MYLTFYWPYAVAGTVALVLVGTATGWCLRGGAHWCPGCGGLLTCPTCDRLPRPREDR